MESIPDGATSVGSDAERRRSGRANGAYHFKFDSRLDRNSSHLVGIDRMPNRA